MSLALKLTAAMSGGGASDPYWANVSSLLHFDGNLTDQTGKSWSATGDASADGTAHFGSNSLDVDGAGDYIGTASHTDFDFGTGDLTIEMFVSERLSAGATYRILAIRATTTSWANGWSLYVNSNGSPVNYTVKLWVYNADRITANTTFLANVFTHVAVCREAGVWSMYIGGVKQSTTYSSSTAPDLSVGLYIGREHLVSGTDNNALIDEFRITKGVARYSANFTPPTEAFPNS